MDTEKFVTEGDEHFKNDDSEKALESYQKALNTNIIEIELYSKVIIKIANVYYNIGEFYKSIELLEQLIKEKNSYSIEGIQLLVPSLMAVAEYKKGIYYSKEGMKLDSKNDIFSKQLVDCQLFSTPPKLPDMKTKNFYKNLKLSKEVKDRLSKINLGRRESVYVELNAYLKLNNHKELHKDFSKIEKLFEIWKFYPKNRCTLSLMLMEINRDKVLTNRMIEVLDVHLIIRDQLEDLIKIQGPDMDEEFIEYLVTILCYYTQSGREIYKLTLINVLTPTLFKIVLGKFPLKIKQYAVGTIAHTCYLEYFKNFILTNPNLINFLNCLLDYFELNPDSHVTTIFQYLIVDPKCPAYLHNIIYKYMRHPVLFMRYEASRTLLAWISDLYEKNHSNGTLPLKEKDLEKLGKLPNSFILKYLTNEKSFEEIIELGKTDFEKSAFQLVNFFKNIEIKSFEIKHNLKEYLNYFQKKGKKYETLILKCFSESGSERKKAIQQGFKEYPNDPFFICAQFITFTDSKRVLLEKLDIYKAYENDLSKNDDFRVDFYLHGALLAIRLFNIAGEEKYGQLFIEIFEKVIKESSVDRSYMFLHYTRYILMKLILNGSKMKMEEFKQMSEKLKEYQEWNEKFYNLEESAEEILIRFLLKKTIFLTKCDEFYKKNPDATAIEESHNCGADDDDDDDEIEDEDDDEFKSCRSCGIQSAKLKLCGRCGKVYYCSQECQKNDWPYHKQICNSSKK